MDNVEKGSLRLLLVLDTLLVLLFFLVLKIEDFIKSDNSYTKSIFLFYVIKNYLNFFKIIITKLDKNVYILK